MSLSELRRAEEAALRIEVRPSRRDPHEVAIVLEGEIDLSTVHAIREVLAALEPEQRHIVLDLAGVTFMDSMGIGLLVEARRRCEPEFRQLSLRRPSVQVRQVLEITGLLHAFPIIDR